LKRSSFAADLTDTSKKGVKRMRYEYVLKCFLSKSIIYNIHIYNFFYFRANKKKKVKNQNTFKTQQKSKFFATKGKSQKKSFKKR